MGRHASAQGRHRRDDARRPAARALARARPHPVRRRAHRRAGQDSDNDALALERARSVQAYAAGDLDGWASHAAAHATELDVSCALVAAARILGRPAVALDDDDALRAMRTAVRDWAGLSHEGALGEADWRAIADLYNLDLAAFLQTDVAGLAELRRTVSWCDSPVHGLGERYPRPEPELVDAVGLAALPHRRCALLVFGPEDGAQSACDGDLAEIYDGTYRRSTLYVPGEVPVEIAVTTASRDPIGRARAWVGVGKLGTSERIADADGTVRFSTFAGDRISVAAAFDAEGLGTMVAATPEGIR